MIILLTTPGIKLMGGGEIGQGTESRYELVEEVFRREDGWFFREGSKGRRKEKRKRRAERS